MAIVVVFGLLVATFMTLVVVPTLYSFFEDMKFMRKRIFHRSWQLLTRITGMNGGIENEIR